MRLPPAPPAGAVAIALTAIALPVAVPSGSALPEASEAFGQSPGLAVCGGTPLPEPDEVITGSFGPQLQGDYVMLPFEVPAGIDAVRVKYCFDQPLLSTQNQHTLDMGIYEARSDAADVWDEDEFRGWGGSSRRDVTVSPEGTIDPDNPVATDKTTVGYRPGPVPAGKWAVELGVAAVANELPTEDGAVRWRVEIDTIDDPDYSDSPFQPFDFDPDPANSDPGWYAGDFHVHARHSNPGDATMREVFDYAFAQPGEGAGLDFITLSDYVGDRAWDEIGFFQDDYPGRQIIRSSEVITYRGHANNHGSAEFVDYRTGRILEGQLLGSGSERTLTGTAELRPARPASEIFDDVHAADGWTQINHPKIFPSEIPTFSSLCRGCPWDYSPAETDYSKVDAIEVATGPAGLQDVPTQPGPNPFTTLGVKFYEDGIDAGGTNANKIAAVGGSDSHNAGMRDDPVTQSPIGQPTTVVHAPELSETGIQQGVEARHTYVKMWGQSGPDLRLEGSGADSGDLPAIMGDTLEADAATFTARVSNLDASRAARPGPYTLVVLRNGLPLVTVPMPTGDEFEFEFPGLGPGRYGIEVIRPGVGVASIESYSTPIWLEPKGGTPPSPPDDCATPLVGTPGDDTFTGTEAGDDFRGGGGSDRIDGGPGDDCLRGGRGPDRIRGGAGEDVVYGNKGADRIKVADGEADVVRCGRSRRDRANADRIDDVRGCERVRRIRG
jgi:hypothetical protein